MRRPGSSTGISTPLTLLLASAYSGCVVVQGGFEIDKVRRRRKFPMVSLFYLDTTPPLNHFNAGERAEASSGPSCVHRPRA